MKSNPQYLALALLCGLSSFASHAAPTSTKPKLIVVLAIDQFRADYLTRFASRFRAPMGFKYLKEKSAFFPLAEYENLQSITCPGHATISTGGYPYQFGIPLNEWWDRERQKTMKCMSDPSFTLIGPKKTDISANVAPSNLRSSTVGDELKNSGQKSKVYAIATKDRAAIAMGGHRADGVFWLDTKSRSWISSTYYYPTGKLPEWVTPLNTVLQKDPDLNKWSPDEHDTTSGISDKEMHSHLSKELQGGYLHIPAQFPKEIKTNDALQVFPRSIQATFDLAEGLVKNEKLGARDTTDMLWISLSAHDYLGHSFGAESVEMEAMTLAEDKEIGRFLAYLQKTIPGGLDNVVFTLTGDHGVAPVVEAAKANKMPAKRLPPEETLQKQLEESLVKELGSLSGKDKYLEAATEGNFYLSRSILKDSTRFEAAESALKKALLATGYFSQVTTSSERAKGIFPPSLYFLQTQHTLVEGRSGDVIAIPFAYVTSAENTADHWTSYSYDRFVPLLFMGKMFTPGTYSQIVKVVDHATTLSSVLQILPPAVSEGRVLIEALKKEKK
jgi:predicted AlkP superfamily pyrophosphatase or phosphodiesterase